MRNFRSKQQLADYINVFYGGDSFNGRILDRESLLPLAERVWPQLKAWPRHEPEGVPFNSTLHNQGWLNRCIETEIWSWEDEMTEREMASPDFVHPVLQ